MRFPRTHGFTLIELLVVISIIALLIGILLPALGAARDTAKTVGCLSNTRQIGIVSQTYLNDYDIYLPPQQSTRPIPNVAAPFNYQYLAYDYLNASDGVFFCPADDFVPHPFNTTYFRNDKVSPSSGTNIAGYSYATNLDLPVKMHTGLPQAQWSFPLEAIPAPSGAALYYETDIFAGLTLRSLPTFFRFDHTQGGLMNLPFADGHSASIVYDDLIPTTGSTPAWTPEQRNINFGGPKMVVPIRIPG